MWALITYMRLTMPERLHQSEQSSLCHHHQMEQMYSAPDGCSPSTTSPEGHHSILLTKQYSSNLMCPSRQWAMGNNGQLPLLTGSQNHIAACTRTMRLFQTSPYLDKHKQGEQYKASECPNPFCRTRISTDLHCCSHRIKSSSVQIRLHKRFFNAGVLLNNICAFNLVQTNQSPGTARSVAITHDIFDHCAMRTLGSLIRRLLLQGLPYPYSRFAMWGLLPPWSCAKARLCLKLISHEHHWYNSWPL
jgi:hypothetical protein